MEKTIELISEDEKSYTTLIDGKKVTLFKVNAEEIKSKHDNDLFEASNYLEQDEIEDMLFFTRRIIQFVPKITEYERVAEDTTKLMERVYDILEPYKLCYLMHNLIKNTKIGIYGKAETFMKQIGLFNEDLEKIFNYMEEVKWEINLVIYKGFKNV